MAITQRTVSQIIQSMVDFISAYNTANNKNIDTRQGTVFKDVVIDAPAQEISTLYSNVVYSSELSALSNAADFTTSDLDAIGANVNITRKTTTYSVGFSDFITTGTEANPPTLDIFINAGTIVKVPSTSTTNEILFRTTQSGVISIATLSNYLFTDTDNVNRYKITIPITAVVPGSEGNVSSFAITSLTTPVAGIGKARNTDPTTGGVDVESNVDYATRIQIKQAGNNIGTAAGLESLILSDSRAINAAIVLPGDPEMLRNQYGGSVDIYVLGQDLEPAIDTIFSNGGTTGYTINLTRLPATSITSVSGTVAGNPYTFNPSTEYSFIKDLGLLKDTVKESSKVQFITSTVPDAGTFITVSLIYDKLTADLQALINLDQNHIITSDILIRRSYEVTVNIDMNVSVFSGYIPSDVATAINTALINKIDSFNLNDDLNTSEIIALANDTTGVNSVILNSPTTTISPGKLGYVRVGITSIHIGNNTFNF